MATPKGYVVLFLMEHRPLAVGKEEFSLSWLQYLKKNNNPCLFSGSTKYSWLPPKTNKSALRFLRKVSYIVNINILFLFLFAAQIACGLRQFQCTNGLCKPMSWVCDGHDDCGDGSDESQITCKRKFNTLFPQLYLRISVIHYARSATENNIHVLYAHNQFVLCLFNLRELI